MSVKGNDFKELWISNRFYVTQHVFPSIYRSSLVVKIVDSMLSPIDNVLRNVIEKNKELQEYVTKYESSPKDSNPAPFAMLLKGVLDAASNGGFAAYKDIFLSEEFLKANPDKKSSADQLREALREQLQIVGKGLNIHSRFASDDQSTFQALDSQFSDLINSIAL